MKVVRDKTLKKSEYRKDAAIIRAEGVAEANLIIGKSLSPQYIQ